MTMRFTPHISDLMIETMDVFDAFRTGEELLADRHPRDAVRVLRKVVDAEPSNAAGWELLGRAHFAAAQLAPAEQAFRRLVELEPASAWAQTALGLSLDRQSRHREGAVHHRIAAAMGASPHDATRVELVDRQTG
jgi:Flp pilus assembly protein TadD